MLSQQKKMNSPGTMFRLGCLVLIFAFVNAEELVINSTSTCGYNFTLDGDESVDIRYRGGLSTDRCQTQFTITSVDDHIICVQPISLDLNCDTRIEYQRYFVAKYVNDGLLTCDLNDLSKYNESCATDVSTFFIVIVNEHSLTMTNETADIRVYAKPRRNDNSDSPSSTGSRFNYAWLSAIPGVIIAMTAAGVCVWRRRGRQQCKHNTRNGADNTNTGYPHAMVESYTVPQSVGDHHAYPTAVAYQRPLDPGRYNFQYTHPSPVFQGVNPSDTAQPQDVKAGLPPSYENL